MLSSQPTRSIPRVALLGTASPLVLLLLACVVGSQVTPILGSGMPRWACPTPTALPPIQVVDGTIANPQGTPVPNYRDTKPYEREPYNQIGKEPILLPTPYTKTGTDFFLGQIVNVAPQIDVQVTGVEQGTPVTLGGVERQLYLLKTTWTNRGAPLPFDPARQMVLTGVKRPDGRLSAGQWRWDATAAEAAKMAAPNTLTTEVPSGASEFILPVLAPVGTVQSVDLQLDPPGATLESAGSLRLQFMQATDPKCEQPGTIGAVYSDTNPGIVAPPAAAGGDKIIAAALKQVGRPYCWGAKGYSPCDGYGGGATQVTPACASYPCFDCSGLTWWAYKEAGIAITQGTVNQKNYPAVSIDQIQPGDLMLFSMINQQGRADRITHVGLYAGDVDGDGTGDMIHSLNYPTGVIITKNILNNRYFMARLVVVTRPPRGENS